MEVSVRSPFPFEALPRVWRWIEGFRHKVSDDFSPKTLDEFVLFMASKYDSDPGMTLRTRKTWAIYGDGELGGLVTFERSNEWAGTAHMLLKPDLQGKGIAVKAARAAVAQMFETGIGKLAFFPLSGNLAIGSMLATIGATREGCLKAHTLCGGKPADVLIYGLTREGFINAISRSHTARSSDLGKLGDRGGSVDSGVRTVGEAEDVHVHADQHPHLDAGSAVADRPDAALHRQHD